MKTTRLIAAIALAFAATTATAAKPVVKVTESYGDGIHYWVKYTINGMEYRSDMAGQAINKKAWLYMSDEDRMKTVRTVTYIWDARQEQFGEIAFEMGKWFDTEMGYTEAAKIKQEELVKKNHHDLWSRFSDENVEAYVRDHVTPAGIAENDDLYLYPELYFKYEELKSLFDWARDAYSRLGPAEWRRTEAAVKSTSGDLIQLICDRVLVPNITPAGMLSGIEAVPSKILGAVFDMANTLSGAQDELVKKVVGERTTADRARLVIDNANNAIASLRKIITTCMNGVQSLRAEIESEYPALKEAHDKREKEVQDAYKAKLQAARDARNVSGMTAEAMSQAQQIAALSQRWGELNTRCEEASERRDWVAAQAIAAERNSVAAELDEYETVVFNRLVERCHEWMMKYFGTIEWSVPAEFGGLIGNRVTTLRAMWEDKIRVHLDNVLASAIINGSSTASFAYLDSKEVLDAIAAAKKYISDLKAQPSKFQPFYAESFSLGLEANKELGELLADEAGMPMQTPPHGPGSGDLKTDLRSYIGILDAFMSLDAGRYGGTEYEQRDWYLSQCTGPEEMYSADEDPHYKLMEMRLERFEKAYSDWLTEDTMKKDFEAAWRPIWDNTVAEFEKANRDYGTFGATLPIFVTEQNIGGNSHIVLDDNTELGRKFLPPNGTAGAAEANSYRQQLDSLMDQRCKLRVDFEIAKQNMEILKLALPSIAEAESNKKQKLKMYKAVANSTPRENMDKLIALWKDFHNRNEAHEKEVAYMLDLYHNEDEYKSTILGSYAQIGEGWEGVVKKEYPDPYLRLAYQARCYGQHETKWSNPKTLYWPAWWQGTYTYPYAFFMEADDCDRGLASYAYFAKDYYKTYFANEPDPFDDFVEPKLNEIDAARAAAAGTDVFTVTFEPNGGGGDEMPPQMFVSGAPQTLNANIWEPPFPGETFLGWALTWDGDVVYTDRQSVTIYENRTLYARWSGDYGGGTVDPTEAPTLFGPVTAELPFMGDATYNGWVRNADGTLAGQLTVKAGKAAKPEKGGQSKLTVTYVPFGGRKQTIKLSNDAMPVAGEVATVAIPGIGTVRFTGSAIVGEGVDVQAGKDTLKSKDRGEKTAATAAAASKAGVWTFALGADAGYAGFTVTVDKKGKGKLAGTLPDGTKVSVSAQGVLGDGVLAIPFAYAKKGTLGLVFWVKGDGSAAVSDLTGVGAASLVAPNAVHRLSDGEHTFRAGGVSQGFTVAGKKWNAPKQNKKADPDPNPTGLKLSFTEKTGAVKGSYTVVDGKAKTKYTVVGVVVGGRFYGSAYARNAGSASATAE